MDGYLKYQLRYAQLAKAEGELRALVALWFEPSKEHGGLDYAKLKKMVDDFAKELHDNFG